MIGFWITIFWLIFGVICYFKGVENENLFDPLYSPSESKED